MKSIDTTRPASLIELVKFRQAEIGLTDQQLGAALGYNRVIIVTLLMQGSMRFPLNKIAALATALAVDPADLMRVALAELSPKLMPVIEQAFNPLQLTQPEKNLIRHLRKLAGDQQLAPIVFDGRDVVALVLPGRPLQAACAIEQG